jgi:hypothetical protein
MAVWGCCDVVGLPGALSEVVVVSGGDSVASAARMMTVLVLAEVRPFWSVATKAKVSVAAVLVASYVSALFVIPCICSGFLQLGEMAPCFRHLEKPRFVAVVCG